MIEAPAAIENLKLQDGDLLVCRYPGFMSLEARNRVNESLEALVVRMGVNVQIMVLEGGMTLERIGQHQCVSADRIADTIMSAFQSAALTVVKPLDSP